MTIRIEIIDPTIKDEKMLVATARFLMELAGHQMVPAPVEVKEQKLNEGEIPVTLEDLKVDGSIGYYEGNPPAHEKLVEEHEKLVAELDNLTIEKKQRRKKMKTTKLEKHLTDKEIDSFLGEKLLESEHVLVEEFNNTPPFFQVTPPPKIDFNSLIGKITKLTAEKKLVAEDVLKIVRSYGLSHTYELSTNPQLIEKVNASIDKFGGDK
jgi:hypothetical protein